MKPLLLAAALGVLAGGALAQNTKGTGAETRTTTTTNPEASVGLPTSSVEGSHATRPSGTDRPNMKATKSAQDQVRKRRQKRCVSQVSEVEIVRVVSAPVDAVQTAVKNRSRGARQRDGPLSYGGLGLS